MARVRGTTALLPVLLVLSFPAGGYLGYLWLGVLGAVVGTLAGPIVLLGGFYSLALAANFLLLPRRGAAGESRQAEPGDAPDQGGM